MRKPLLAFTPVLLGLFLAGACGGSGDESKVGDGTNSGASGGVPSSDTDSDVDLGGSDGNGMGGTGSTDWDPNSSDACADSTENANLTPVHLLVLLDESGSMGDGVNGNIDEKWNPVTDALKQFFADPESAGLIASLSIFPADLNTTNGAADENIEPYCQGTDYETSLIDWTDLPEDTLFADAIDALAPPNEFGTPTRPALEGAVTQAEALLDEDEDAQVAILLVTDGEPYQCNDNTPTSTAAVAAAVADHILTYVIGVGDSLDALNEIAVGGGTDAAFLVALDDPEQTKEDLLQAVNEIRGNVVSCDIPIPTPEMGTIDFAKVNVQYTSGDDVTGLSKNASCKGGVGWRYDDADDPTMINLCDETCAEITADPEAQLGVVFGCETKDGGIK